jgi:hypothetical protein
MTTMYQCFRPLNAALFLLCALEVLSGCGKRVATKLQRNDAATAASKAIEAYDKNGDGKLSAEEFSASPALAASLRRIDSNDDKIMSKEEIQARLESLDAQADYIGLDVRVTSKGKPLADAEVTFQAEPFLGDVLPTFSGTTNDGGGCPLKSEGKQLPGIPIGLYQVKIVNAKQRINTVRGVEIADDTTGNRLEIAL